MELEQDLTPSLPAGARIERFREPVAGDTLQEWLLEGEKLARPERAAEIKRLCDAAVAAAEAAEPEPSKPAARTPWSPGPAHDAGGYTAPDGFACSSEPATVRRGAMLCLTADIIAGTTRVLLVCQAA